MNKVERVERGEVTDKDKVTFQLSIEGTTDEDASVDLAEDLLEQEKSSTPRIPVPVALGITVGWIFACAGLFKIWEPDWTYAESCYFMFISLSTIGLGDVAVKRRDLMVLCFVFVIIGLSLVSMCIGVIQSALEDLYMNILLKMIVEYQNKLSQGDTHAGASMGMMHIWGGNKTAKFLMPLLSKDKRKTAMEKVQDVAEAKGMEIPKIFSEIDEKTGMPNVFSMNEKEEALEETIRHVEREAELEAKQSCASILSRNIVMYDSVAQTDNPYMEERCEQTEQITTADANVGNESDSKEYECTAVQCERVSILEDSAQTFTPSTRNDDTMTETVPCSQSTVQTECVATQDQELQSHLADYVESEAQTDPYQGPPRSACTCTAVQTEKRKYRVRNSSLTRLERRKSASASFSVWKDPLVEELDESSDSAESLDWNPRDGLHAEKQRSVRDLKKFWDVKSTASSISNPERGGYY
ncbi:unnamed protein product [Enterobius vermicularis]|uniref:Potassium channel domain-containing protein n=1 Tax=Enterobius vermicularis TaxID=51028 RepID=A0A3P6HKC7_ENTVE|nr:unnamed protein product [Enterobius vermicularis]